MKSALSCAVLALAAASCEQSSAQIATDPYGPVRCWVLAWQRGLDEDHAIQLCQGALNAVPGQCYSEAADRLTTLSTQQIMTLCIGTTSLEPLSCFGRLAAMGTMTEDQMINYCATACALGPPPAQTSSAQCQAIAVERANLPHQTAQQLCQNARSAGPALCFLSGRGLHTISDSKLVTLCADYGRCQYVNVTPPP
jgi:hypothetical protein